MGIRPEVVQSIALDVPDGQPDRNGQFPEGDIAEHLAIGVLQSVSVEQAYPTLPKPPGCRQQTPPIRVEEVTRCEGLGRQGDFPRGHAGRQRDAEEGRPRTDSVRDGSDAGDLKGLRDTDHRGLRAAPAGGDDGDAAILQRRPPHPPCRGKWIHRSRPVTWHGKEPPAYLREESPILPQGIPQEVRPHGVVQVLADALKVNGVGQHTSTLGRACHRA